MEYLRFLGEYISIYLMNFTGHTGQTSAGEAEMHVHTHSLEDGQRKLVGGPAMTKQQLLSSETQ